MLINKNYYKIEQLNIASQLQIRQTKTQIGL